MPPGAATSDDRKQAEDGDVAIVDGKTGRPGRLEGADEQTAEKSAGNRADAAEDGGDQRLQAEAVAAP